ncbi:hypothetical protein [Roseburia sp. 831b]|uniref:hypothetical protein n=1 Tax=Roseburia sp. 831b TaxID=1261635 RepID=UPI00095113CB|nr:hypothetical protein [Roseburia sp. 831b]WVK74222.1 hypothetical protein BIV16_06820 [Roseburia sp. 831b]
MKEKDAGNYHNVRCSVNNPQHVYVHKILNDLNLDIYKSRNQFIIDAIEFYSKSLNQEDLTQTATMEHIKDEKQIKASDLEKLKQDVVSEVMIAVQREVIAILAHAVANSQNNNQQMYQKQSQEPIEEKTDTKDAINPIVADMASLWGEDEETEE